MRANIYNVGAAKVQKVVEKYNSGFVQSFRKIRSRMLCLERKGKACQCLVKGFSQDKTRGRCRGEWPGRVSASQP